MMLFLDPSYGGSGNSSKSSQTPRYSILGPTVLSAEHLNLFVKNTNPNAIEVGSFYVTFGEHYGIRGDIAFAQALLETNYFRFTGDVRGGQNNFAGIGATGSLARGATFATPEEGVLAHLQHLFAYATSAPLPNQFPLVDPRFHLVRRGSAPTWVDLNGKWAVPGNTYGQSILNLYGRIIDSSIQNLKDVRNRI
jgi:N-acetylmuramoyl-L-alanine amidase